MGRRFALVILCAIFAGCVSPSEENAFSACEQSSLVLLPHHLLVEPLMRDVYESIQSQTPEKIIVVSPNHFHEGDAPVAKATATEHGFTVHEDLIREYFGENVTVEGWMINVGSSSEVLTQFAKTLETENSLVIFSVDFSHYLPGKIAYVHDALSADVIESRSIEDAKKLEVDSPESVEVMLRLAEALNLKMKVLRNTNPSLETDYETFENTTHIFACSTEGIPPARQVKTSMYFKEAREFYEGKSMEDRYLYGYDDVFFDTGEEKDRAVIEYGNGEKEEMTFDYF